MIQSFFHMSRYLSCRGLCKIVTWYGHFFTKEQIVYIYMNFLVDYGLINCLWIDLMSLITCPSKWLLPTHLLPIPLTILELRTPGSELILWKYPYSNIDSCDPIRSQFCTAQLLWHVWNCDLIELRFFTSGRHACLQDLIMIPWIVCVIWPPDRAETCCILQWRHNGHDCVSNHQPHQRLRNRLFERRSKKTSKLRVTGLCVGNSPGTVNSPRKWPITRKMFPFDDVIMIVFRCSQ